MLKQPFPNSKERENNFKNLNKKISKLMLKRVKRINTAAFNWNKDKCLIKVNIPITLIMILIKRVKLCPEKEKL